MLRLCPSSQAEGYQLGIAGEHISTGIAVDEILTSYLTKTAIDVAGVATRHDVSLEEVANRVTQGLAVLNAISHLLERPQVQVGLDGPMGTGTPDAFSIITQAVLDWKSREGDHWDQMMHYAHSLRNRLGVDYVPDRGITMIIAWLATGTYEIREIDDAGLDAWAVEQDRFEAQVGTVFRPDPETCPRCHRRLECPARRDQAQGALIAMGSIIPIEEAAQLYPSVMQLEKYIKEYRATVKEAVIASGPIPVGDGQELAVIDVDRTGVDTAKGLDALNAAGWDGADIEAVTKLEIGKIKKHASSVAPRGVKKAAAEMIVETLTNAGAITTTSSKTLKMRKAREVLDD